jgi:hypothetical protein
VSGEEKGLQPQGASGSGDSLGGASSGASYWSFFAEDARRTGSPLYARLAEAISGDEALKALAANARKGQPHANMLLGAVHFLLLRGKGGDHPLRAFYPTLGGTAKVDERDPFHLFKDFVARHEEEILPLVRTRVTNTNEVGRSALLHPGFRRVAELGREPLNLIEIGPSAGLNLLWDRYGVRYLSDGKLAAETAHDAKLVLDVELRGPRVPRLGPLPRIGRRIGLELNPVDLSNPDDRDWLRALIFPDMTGRTERLEKALAAFDPKAITLRQGDALALLSDAIAEIPEAETVCVYHTIAIYQFSRAMRATLEDILAMVGVRRPVLRLSLEYVSADGACMFDLISYRDGVREETRLASSHPHGRWVEWLD